MNKSTLLRIILLILMACSSCTSVHSHVATQSDHFHTKLAKCQETVQKWDNEATTQLVLTLLVIVSGAAITGLQGLTKGWVKPLTIVLGICTTVFTAVNARVFADYRVLAQAAVDGDELIDTELSTLADQLAAGNNSQNLAGLNSEWLKALGEFKDIENRVIQGVNTENTSPAFYILRVYAQASSAEPSWVTHPPPSDQNNLYYIGQGKDSSIAVARQLAHDRAIASALSDLWKLTPDHSALRDLITSSADFLRDAFTLAGCGKSNGKSNGTSYA
jgi:uncharacterized protein YceK